ncbi:putative valacyclovir hydrolase [Mycena leptocephala]|nr:putative valacyclovir hydrolase [Mycena leptocephala]
MALLPGGRDYVLPRPGSSTSTDSSTPTPRIAAPSEAAFTSIFGMLLPPAKFLTTPHGRTAFYDFPPASSSPSSIDPISRVIMIHGVCTPALGLLPLARTLLAAHPNTHLVLYDLWGHSLSDTPAVPHTPALFHAQLLALLVHLGWADLNVVGYSFGGAIAAGFAARYPETVKSLVLVATAGLMRVESFGEHGECSSAAARDWVLQLLEGGPLIGEVVSQKVRGWQQEEHRGHVASSVAIFRDGGAIGLHEEFTKAAQGVPHILAILGELDDICSKEDLVAVGVQPENVVVVEDVGHGLVRERVGRLQEQLGDFGRGWGGRRAGRREVGSRGDE